MRRDPERTLAAIRAIGYTDVELLWSFKNFDRTPQQVRATLDKEGLRAPSAHMDPEHDSEELGEESRGGAPARSRVSLRAELARRTTKTIDGWRQWADHFNTAGAAAREAGVWLGVPQRAESHASRSAAWCRTTCSWSAPIRRVVRHQLDVGNMAIGGGDPLAVPRRSIATAIGAFTSRTSSPTARRTRSSGKGRSTSAACSRRFRTSTGNRCSSSRRVGRFDGQRADELRVPVEARVLETGCAGLPTVARQRRAKVGAGNGIRTRDFDLGKVALYH